MYINGPTQQLIGAVEKLVSRDDLSEHPEVMRAFRSFQEISREVPGFVRLIHQRTDFSPTEITLIEIYLMLRVLSTYAAIPVLVGHLQLLGEYELAARINSNAVDEGGGKGNSSHHELLVTSLSIVAKRVGGLPVTTKRLVAAIRVYELGAANSGVWDQDALWVRLNNDGRHLSIERDELPVTIAIARLLDDETLRYHRHVHQTLLIPAILEPSSKEVLALATLELAKREAESVDDKEVAPSFIGAWEQFIQAHAIQFSPAEYRSANAWARAHNDEQEAKKAGWGDRSAEDGHARDARDAALYFLAALNQAEFTRVLEHVTENARLRLRHWDHLVASVNLSVGQLRQDGGRFDHRQLDGVRQG